MPMALLRCLLAWEPKKMRFRPRVIRACTRAELTVFRLLRHWRPSSWANRESSRTIVAECSACQTWIICDRCNREEPHREQGEPVPFLEANNRQGPNAQP